MTEDEQSLIFDTAYEMRGLAATLLAASRGDLQEPEKVLEYAAGQVSRLAGNLTEVFSENPENRPRESRSEALKAGSPSERRHPLKTLRFQRCSKKGACGRP